MAGRDARPEFPVGPFYVKECQLKGFVVFKASADEIQIAAEDRTAGWPMVRCERTSAISCRSMKQPKRISCKSIRRFTVPVGWLARLY